MKRRYDLADLRARQITEADFDRHELILVMDWDNLALVEDICPPEARKKVRRLTCKTMNVAAAHEFASLMPRATDGVDSNGMVRRCVDLKHPRWVLLLKKRLGLQIRRALNP